MSKKKIISLIQKENINEKEYNTLCFLTQLDLDEKPLVCRDIWIQIPLNYTEFKRKQSELQIDINARYSLRDSEIYYKTRDNHGVFLPKNKINQLNANIREKLVSICSKKGFFDDSDLQNMRRDNLNDLENSRPHYRYLTPAECQQEQDASPYTQVGEWENNEHYERHQEAKNIQRELEYDLRRIICCVRFAEYSNDLLFQKLELDLSKKLLTMEEKRVFGFELLNKLDNTRTREQIQNELNECLLKETNPERIEYWVQKGADINVVNEEGITILGTYLKNPRHKDLNVSVPKMIALGLNVNVGLDRESGKNNLMLAFRNHRPEISDDTINLIIENATLATINYLQKCGTALHYAIFSDSNRPACVKKLMDKGASSSLADELGNTPLMMAAKGDHLYAVELILECNPGVIDYQDKEGNTALMKGVTKYYGVQKNTLAIISVLIESGADIDRVNKDGKTAGDLTNCNSQIAAHYSHCVEQLQSLNCRFMK